MSTFSITKELNEFFISLDKQFLMILDKPEYIFYLIFLLIFGLISVFKDMEKLTEMQNINKNLEFKNKDSQNKEEK